MTHECSDTPKWMGRGIKSERAREREREREREKRAKEIVDEGKLSQ